MALASWGTCRCARSQMKILSRLVNIQMMPLQSCESIELQFYNLFLLFSHDVVSLMYNINGGGQFPVRYVMLVCLCFLPAFVTKELDHLTSSQSSRKIAVLLTTGSRSANRTHFNCVGGSYSATKSRRLRSVLVRGCAHVRMFGGSVRVRLTVICKPPCTQSRCLKLLL